MVARYTYNESRKMTKKKLGKASVHTSLARSEMTNPLDFIPSGKLGSRPNEEVANCPA